MLTNKYLLKLDNFFLFLLSNCWIFAFNSIPVYSLPCPNRSDVSESTTDSWRGTHCEGIVEGEIEQTRNGSFRLISLAIGQIKKYDDQIVFKIPGSQTKQIKLKIESLAINYLSNNFNFSQFQNSSSVFSLPAKILRDAEVPPESLNFLAWQRLDANKIVYLPVIHDSQVSPEYEMIWFTRYKAKIKRFEIRSQTNQVVYSCLGNNISYRANTEVSCQWDGKNTSAGTYTMYLEVEQFPFRKPKRELKRQIRFLHNPQWLK